MSQLSTYVSCPDIQLRLNEIVECDPALIVEPTVLTNFLLSDLNLTGARQGKLTSTIAPGNSKRRRVEVVYSPRLSEDDVLVGEGRDNCSVDNKIGETSQLYEIGDDEYIQAEASMNIFELSTTCEDNSERFARTLMMLMSQVDRKMESTLFDQLLAQYGSYAVDYPGVTDKILAVQTKYSDERYNVDAFENLGTAARWNAYCSVPFVIGGVNWGKYMRATNAGCCSRDGINVAELAAQYGMIFAESYRADAQWGLDYAMMLDAGHAQLIEWLEFEGPNGINMFDMADFKAMVIVNPRNGNRYDVKITVDCNLNISIILRKYFKLATLPDDMFYAEDRLSGVNGINRLVIDNPAA